MNDRTRILLLRYNPSVRRRYLLALSGMLWGAAGTILCVRTAGWLSALPLITAAGLAAVGSTLALLVYVVFFSRLVNRNIGRILALPERACLFAFTPWRGYFMIALMVGLGIAVRNSSAPTMYLSIPYSAMGGTLLIGGFRFFREFTRHV